MTYTVYSGTLNSTIPYHYLLTLQLLHISVSCCVWYRRWNFQRL